MQPSNDSCRAETTFVEGKDDYFTKEIGFSTFIFLDDAFRKLVKQSPS